MPNQLPCGSRVAVGSTAGRTRGRPPALWLNPYAYGVIRGAGFVSIVERESAPWVKPGKAKEPDLRAQVGSFEAGADGGVRASRGGVTRETLVNPCPGVTRF